MLPTTARNYREPRFFLFAEPVSSKTDNLLLRSSLERLREDLFPRVLGRFSGYPFRIHGTMVYLYIYIYIYFRYFFNGECIGKYTIHGSYGLGSLPICWRHKK